MRPSPACPTAEQARLFRRDERRDGAASRHRPRSRRALPIMAVRAITSPGRSPAGPPSISKIADAGRDPNMDWLVEWLPANIPAGDDAAIVHGDFRIDNMIFHPTEPRILAVLDWELSTLGHPLADFTYHAMMYRMPPLYRGRPARRRPRSAEHPQRGATMSRPIAAAQGGRASRTTPSTWRSTSFGWRRSSTGSKGG